MQSENFTEEELEAFAEHEAEMRAKEESICQAVNDLRLTTMTREGLERFAADCYLRLDHTEPELAKLVTTKAELIIGAMAPERAKSKLIQRVYAIGKKLAPSRGGKKKHEEKSSAIAEIVAEWEVRRDAFGGRFPHGYKESFLDEILDREKYKAIGLSHEHLAKNVLKAK